VFKVALIDSVKEYNGTENNNKIKVVNIIELQNLSSLDDMRRFMNVPYIMSVNNDVKIGMLYDPNTNIIYNELGDQVYPPMTPDLILQKVYKAVKELTFTQDLEDLSLTELQNYLIKKSKKNLEIYLENHPMKYNNKYYTVTSSKQNQLTELLNAYKFADNVDKELELYWNETGKEFETYTYEDLINVYLAMLEYVKPIVVYQQQIETQIRKTNDTSVLVNIDISFDNYNL